MKPSIILFLLCLCLFLSPFPLLSQDSIQYRKLYLHTDREHYFLGDTLWYKGYYLDGQSNNFIPGIISMYADLIDEQGKSVADQVVALDNGASTGAILIPVELEPGIYMLRAFTDFQKQIGEEAFFYKQLKISKLESFVESTEEAEQKLPEKIYLDFLPEGGMLLEGHMGDYWSIANSAIDIRAYIPEYTMNPVADVSQAFLPMGTGEEIPGFCLRSASYENPKGNWNTLELVCFEDKSIHIVNGQVVMVLRNSRYVENGTPLPLTSGKIQLQSEAAEVYFKNIEIRQLETPPKEYIQFLQ